VPAEARPADVRPADARAASPGALPARTALDDYVEREDPSYRWTVVRSSESGGFRVHVIDMTSQSWRSPEEIDRTLWQHWLVVVVPRTDAPAGAGGSAAPSIPKTALLFIGGGRNGGEPPAGPDQRTAALAQRTGAVVAELRMVPNQPLAFRDDGRPRVEDDLIAGAWNKFIAGGDATWAPRLPMVKSAVRAMDTVQAFLSSPEGGGIKIEDFVVAGGSKRGWTTWLTGVVDRRVVAIAPLVIDVLNVIPSMEHHFAAYGFWAPAIGDYEQNGIMEQKDNPRYHELIRLVDPYFYRHRLKLPKYLINASGDEFFLPDSSRFYFDDLQGEKHLRYVPNAKHGLGGSDALESLAAFFQSVAQQKPRPRYRWRFEGDDAVRVEVEDRPREVKLWQATNPSARDFRLDTIGPAWTSSALEESTTGVYTARVPAPPQGWTAFFVELTFDGPAGAEPWKFTSGVRVVPDTLPHLEKLQALGR
jgi:PhoPQ-activated pathogenicity-related protein